MDMDVHKLGDDGTRRFQGANDPTTGGPPSTASVQVRRVAGQPAGLMAEWITGYDEETGTTFSFLVGAGVSSTLAHLRVDVPGHAPVFENVDLRPLVTDRVNAIIAEASS